jgi:hypothetical protein
MCVEDLEPRQHVRKGYAAVFLPVFDHLLAVDKDDEVVYLALVDDFGLRGVSARHFEDRLIEVGICVRSVFSNCREKAISGALGIDATLIKAAD